MSIRNELPTPNRFSTTALQEVNVEESIAWKGHLVGKLFPPLKSAFNAIKTAIEKVLYTRQQDYEVILTEKELYKSSLLSFTIPH